jgi:DNA-binding response OmpR family regulator
MTRVFLLSDDLRLRGQIELELRRSHHLVQARGTGPFFTNEARSFAPDVIILDCRDETRAAQARLELLRDAVLGNVPLVAIAHSSEEAHAFGAQALLPRPVHSGDIIHVLSALVPARSAQQL